MQQSISPSAPAAGRNFICPITQERFQEPVNTLAGQTYELKAIQQWIQQNLHNNKFKDPLSGTLCNPILIPNRFYPIN